MLAFSPDVAKITGKVLETCMRECLFLPAEHPKCIPGCGGNMICGSSCWAWSREMLQPRRRRRALQTPCQPGSSTPLGLTSIRARELPLNLPSEYLQ